LPGPETVSQLPFCHPVQAKRDTESSIFSQFWMPACAGMTALMVLSAIATQSLERGICKFESNMHHKVRQTSLESWQKPIGITTNTAGRTNLVSGDWIYQKTLL